MKKLELLIGVSGAGKTTYCNSLNPQDYIVFCPDKMRAIIGTDETDQTVNSIVFATIHRAVDYLFKYGQHSIVIDATNYSIKNRKEFINIARKNNIIVEAIYFPVPLQIAKDRNAKRSRIVPDAVITRQFDSMEWPTFPEVDKIVFFDNGNFIRGKKFNHLSSDDNTILQTSIDLIDKGKSPFAGFTKILQFALTS